MKFSIAHVALATLMCLGSLSLSLAKEVIGGDGFSVVNHRAAERALQNEGEDPLQKAGGILAALYSQFMAATSPELTEPRTILGDGGKAMSSEPNWIEFLNADLGGLVDGFYRGMSDYGHTKSRMPLQDGTVAIEIVTAGEGSILQGVIEELSSHGFELTETYRHTACGTIPIAAIPDMCTCGNLIFARPVISKTNADARPVISKINSIGSGSVISEGVYSLQAYRLQSPPYNLSGANLTIGVLSDSYNRLGGAAADISTGDLPGMPAPTVLKEGHIDGTDEGRAMMQLIYDVAPGVNLVFHTASGGMPNFATGIKKLADFGCDIIVDDILYFDEPFFQDGIVAQAVNEMAARGIPYFSSAGNYGQRAYSTTFSSTGGEETILSNVYTSFHDFGGGSQFQQFNVLPGINIMVLQWDEPYASASPGGVPGASKDLDVFLYNATGSLVQKATANNIGRDPTEILGFQSPIRATYSIRIGVRNGSLPPGFIKLVAFRGFDISNFSNAGASIGHALATGGAGIGAAYWVNTSEFNVSTPVIRESSSAGGNPFFFDVNGDRLAQPEIRKQPRFTGPTRTVNTFFGDDIGDGQKRFSGTSAAAPHVAAVAALLLEFDSTLTPHGIYKLLEDTALDMDDPGTQDFDMGFDYKTGYGLVNAFDALLTLLTTPPPTPAPMRTPTTQSTRLAMPPVTPAPSPLPAPISTLPVTPAPTPLRRTLPS